MNQVEATPAGCGPSAMVSASIVKPSLTTQFSTDGGATWSLLFSYGNHTDWVEYDGDAPAWKRYGVKLPADSWSPSTRFRIVRSGPPSWTPEPDDRVAIDYLYVGPACPEQCRGNGRCSLSGCLCDTGYDGPNCVPSTGGSLSGRSGGSSSVASGPELILKGGQLVGTDPVLTDGDACFVHGATNYHFDQAGIRMLETREIEFVTGVSVHFLLRLGYCDDPFATNDLTNVTRVQVQSSLIALIL